MDETDRDFWKDAYREDPDHAIVEDFFLSDETEWELPAKFDLLISTYALPGGDDK